ncbi:hypothetical protein pdam_00019585 [Pocillopora damicornis]|uniref:Uncharacterized protein n=1 Tax=Pocillopora damicornis TaxID=46731 RepID=A0A3M6UQK7_POCDA|nr:hypothetical protein pdam_00019585 [Pocillopora damicornis]
MHGKHLQENEITDLSRIATSRIGHVYELWGKGVFTKEPDSFSLDGYIQVCTISTNAPYYESIVKYVRWKGANLQQHHSH